MEKENKRKLLKNLAIGTASLLLIVLLIFTALFYLLDNLETCRSSVNDESARRFARGFVGKPKKEDYIIHIQCPGWEDSENAFIIQTTEKRLEFLVKKLIRKYDLKRMPEKMLNNVKGKGFYEDTVEWPIKWDNIDEAYSYHDIQRATVLYVDRITNTLYLIAITL